MVQSATNTILKEKQKYNDMLQEDIALIQKDAKALKDSVLQTGPFTNNLVSKDPDNIEEADIYEASRRIK